MTGMRQPSTTLAVVGILLVPAAGPVLLWSLVALGMRHGAVAGVALVGTALMAELLAFQWRRRIRSHSTLVAHPLLPDHLIGRLVGPHPPPTGRTQPAVRGPLTEAPPPHQFRPHEGDALGVGS